MFFGLLEGAQIVLWAVNGLAETLYIILGKSWRIGEVPGGQRTNVICIFKNGWGREKRKKSIKIQASLFDINT